MSSNTNSVLILTCTALVLLAGCAELQRDEPTCGPICVANVTIPDALKVAEDILGRMHFAIEKSDPNTSIIRTRPLAGARFFEFWRNDLAGFAEANLHSIRRVVQLNFNGQDNKLCINCTVQVQRLTLAEHEVASSSGAYRMYSQSTPSMQILKLSLEQKQGMAWVDLGNDAELAAHILKRIEKRLSQTSTVSRATRDDL